MTHAASVPPPQSSRCIRVLPEAVTARIAAGEVVERPASVVKELAENALDAGARRIHVEIAGGGRELIRVSDDGVGMSAEDLALCVLAHATSKLTSADELTTLLTLGFRGEALPSIAAVSKFSITSRARAGAHEPAGGEAGAWRVEIAGGQPERPQPHPAAGPFGTTVEVQDLFHNLPARAKFLKGAGAEAAACTDTLLRLALTRPDVGFTLQQDRHEIFSVLPETTTAPAAARPAGHAAPVLPPEAFCRRAREVLGRSNSQGLLEVAAGDGDGVTSGSGYRLYGLISPPALTRPNRGAIYLSVNGRPVRDRTLTSALLEACRHLLPPKRYPIAVLYLELPPLDVDVNVHPTKAEVRFRLPGLVYALFHHAVRSACGLPAPSSVSLPAASETQGQTSASVAGGRRELKPAGSGATFDLWPHTQPQPADSPRPAYSPPVSHAQPARVAEGAPVFDPLVKEGRGGVAVATAEAGQTHAPAAEPPRPEYAVQPFRVLGQAGGSYIVIEDDSGIQVLDQHALHERVLFEELLWRANRRARGDAQGLLLAETVELTPVQAAAFAQDQAAGEVLKHLGFDIEPFGPRTVVVRAVPAILKSAPAGLAGDVLDALAATDDAPGGRRASDRSFYREKAAYVVACRGAVKAGERLTFEQMAALVAEYRKRVGAGAFTCPHGRPVAVALSWDELERAVNRR